MVYRVHLHLVSDATGETLESVVKAALAQFDGVDVAKHYWPMIRSPKQMERVMQDIAERPGLVLYTLVNETIREVLQASCRELGLVSVSVLDPVIQALQPFLGLKAHGRPGRQHAMNAAYFRRIEAMQFTLAHDDGHLPENMDDADIVIAGVSRTSKTPTSMYLANRGYKTTNIPLVPETPIPQRLFAPTRALVVGLTTAPDRLVQIRKNRLLALKEEKDTSYIDQDSVRAEITFARRLFSKHGWPVIDVTRRSIEETAAAIIALKTQGDNDG
ncbi:MAG: pyruvate, water dikinase regulatory protein [Pseudomonadota bacterium]